MMSSLHRTHNSNNSNNINMNANDIHPTRHPTKPHFITSTLGKDLLLMTLPTAFSLRTALVPSDDPNLMATLARAINVSLAPKTFALETFPSLQALKSAGSTFTPRKVSHPFAVTHGVLRLAHVRWA
jgi:hypothetical protein